ncbi:AhpC/TSA family protein [Dethiobacter alkaliphilus]|uniref:Alkyl hydroperoxide reductase/ Thiol specific antioxidant/ Mal allergen n=1 Tax=Dethiobacter alkaliphilus AHT 1 TaxID=555088 RepID=C0GJ57_DETAL|nr:AhpC/TSA family protein [Dethiobacter alkaliphilus]EEG76690.1 conserved hypothetical protein [Dethiobacter alkaliphilus AHT 1]
MLGRAHLAQLRQQYGEIQHAGGEVVVVSFDDAGGVKKLIESHKLPFVFLLDPQREVYQLYGMMYKETGSIVTWKTVLAYLKLRFAGYPKSPPGKDVRQMGGDVVVDRDGIIRFLHRSQHPEDWPDVAELLTYLKQKLQNP